MDSSNLNVVAYGYGLGWSNNSCSGSGIPEYDDILEVDLEYSADNVNWTISGYLTDNSDAKNVNDIFGLYIASVPGGILAGDTIPYTQLNGPGYYRLVVWDWFFYAGGWHGGEGISNTIYANLSRPPR